MATYTIDIKTLFTKQTSSLMGGLSFTNCLKLLQKLNKIKLLQTFFELSVNH